MRGERLSCSFDDDDTMFVGLLAFASRVDVALAPGRANRMEDLMSGMQSRLQRCGC
jgi:hypothetical protein